MLNDQKNYAIELLASGDHTKSEISEIIGISRQSIYNWLDDPEFNAELDKRLRGRKQFLEKIIDSKLENVVNNLFDLANDSSNKRVQAQVNLALLDRGFGKVANEHKISTSIDETDNSTNRKEVQSWFEEIEEDTSDDESDEN